MDYFLFIGYLFLFSWLLTKLGLFRQSGLTNAQLIILFLLKVIAGIFYGWVGVYYGYFAYMYDTWGYHNNSIQELELLFEHPHEYFTNLFTSGYPDGYDGFFASSESYWNDLKSNVYIKLLSVFDLLSFGNYYINVIFYSFLTLSGPVMIYRVMTDLFPGKKIIILIGVFLIPSFLYWSSGLHKDGLTFTALSVLIYHFYFGWKKGRISFANILVMLLAVLILLAMRNYILLLLVPGLVAWGLTRKKERNIGWGFVSVYAVAVALFFLAPLISPSLDFPAAVANKQAAFMRLEGGSGLKVTPLEPHFMGFVRNAPEAIVNSLLRPFPADIKHMLSLGVMAENLFFLGLILLFLFFRDRSVSLQKPFIFFCYFFGFTLLLTIGYTVCFQGAIVRYRSILIPFMITPLLTGIDWERVKSTLINNIKK